MALSQQHYCQTCNMLAFFAVTHTCIRVPICNLFDFSGETQTAASLDTSVSCLEPIWKVTLMGLTTTTAVPLSSRSGALRSAPRSPPAIFPFQRQLAKTWNPKANESEAIRIDSKETKTEKSALPRTSFFKNLSQNRIVGLPGNSVHGLHMEWKTQRKNTRGHFVVRVLSTYRAYARLTRARTRRSKLREDFILRRREPKEVNCVRRAEPYGARAIALRKKRSSSRIQPVLSKFQN